MQGQDGEAEPERRASSTFLCIISEDGMGGLSSKACGWERSGIIVNLKSEVGSPLYGDFQIQADA